MAVNYVTIGEMQQITRPAATDKILVAKADGNDTGYMTYQCTLQSLSNAISCDIADAAKSNLLISVLNEAALATNTMAPACNVLLSVYLNEKYISAHYLNADSKSSRDVSGDINFTRKSPKVPTLAVNSNNAQRTVNCQTLSNYVDKTMNVGAIGNYNPQETVVYKFVADGADSENVYEKQLSSTIKRKYDATGDVLTHRCEKDCTVFITSGHTGFNAFVYKGVEGKTETKKKVKANGKDLVWHIVGSANEGNVVSFNVKAGASFSVFSGKTISETKWLPNYSSYFQPNSWIRVNEYRK